MQTDLSPELLRTLVQKRRSTRDFDSATVPRDTIRDLLRDVLWAPSPHNSQPWRFTVLFSDLDKQTLADAMALRLIEDLRAYGATSDVIERQSQRSRTRIGAAPVVIVCSLHAEGLVHYPDSHRNDLEWQMAVQSVGAALQTLFLLAAAREIGTCWMAAPMYCPDIVRDVLDLPDDFLPQALVLMGYPRAPRPQRDRRPWETVVDLR